MIENLLGIEQLPLPVKLIVAFVIVLALIALATWVFRRVGGNRLGAPSARGRQPRLAVIDAAAVDGRRRLVLIRRDNVEHLVMIGGPTDVVVEQNIVRAVPVAQPREGQQRAPSEPTPRPAGEPIARAEPPRGAPVAERPSRVPRPEPVARVPRPEPPRVSPLDAPRPRPAPAQIATDSGPVDLHSAHAAADTNLSDMAHKLEAALRRPSAPRRDSEATPGLGEPTPPTAPDSNGNGTPRPQGAAAAPQAGGAAPDARSPSTPTPQKSVFDSLEEEMASLLVKPPSKP